MSTNSRATVSAAADDDLEVVPLSHPLRLVSGLIIGLVVLRMAISVVTNPNYQWGVVRDYITRGIILEGLLRTLLLTVVAMTLGILGGAVLAVMRLSPNPVLRQTAMAYIWLFRGTPLLVQLIFWFNAAALYHKFTIGLPFGGPSFVVVGNVNGLITAYVAAFLGLSLNEAAYMAEIVRAGISSVDSGQTEAAQALGLRRAQILKKIILPQALRVIIPPTGNQVIGMLKVTSLVSVIALPELLYSAQLIYAQNFQTIPLLIVASIWYIVLTTILTIVQHFVERRFSRGRRRPGPVTVRNPSVLNRLLAIGHS